MSYNTLRKLRIIFIIAGIAVLLGFPVVAAKLKIHFFIVVMAMVGLIFIYSLGVLFLADRLQKAKAAQNRQDNLRAQSPSPHGNAPTIPGHFADQPKEEV